MQSELLLEICNLSIGFSDGNTINTAVDSISFSLNKNETLAIVGESGSGKSVTALSIMQLLPTSTGKIINGEIKYYSNDKNIDFAKLSEKVMRKHRGKSVAMIFQEPMTSLNPVRTCGKQLRESILVHNKISRKEAKQKSIELLTKVRLPNPEKIYNSYPFELSGGQKQRIMIAMAISCNPTVLIADEPTTALDVTIQKSILLLLKDLQKEYGMGMLFITHDLGIVAEIADRVAVMYKGKIVEQNDASSIFSQPQHPYTKGLLACRPQLNANARKLPVISDFFKIEMEAKNVAIDNKDQLTISTEQTKDSLKNKINYTIPILEVDKLSTNFITQKSFLGKITKQFRAVNNVSFKVYPGETLGLVGESGCGKTTLGRSILQLIKPTEGEILYNSKNITQLTNKNLRKLRKDIQIIFQDPYSSLNPRISVGNAIIEPMIVHRLFNNANICKKNAIEILERVGMNETHFNRYPHEFSGGQRQRICIARALAVQPKFIICDESVSALDVSVQAQVLNLLNELKQDFGFTYIFISHDLSVVKYMSDRIMVMKNSEIVEIGKPEEIYSNPKTAYTRQLIDAIPKVKYR